MTPADAGSAPVQPEVDAGVDAGQDAGTPDGAPPDASAPEVDAGPPPDPNLGMLGGPCQVGVPVEHLGATFAPAVGQCRRPLVCGAENTCIAESACVFPLREPCTLTLSAAASRESVVSTPGHLYWTEPCTRNDSWDEQAQHDGRLLRLDLATGLSEVLVEGLHEAGQIVVDEAGGRVIWSHYAADDAIRSTSLASPHASRVLAPLLDPYWTFDGQRVWQHDGARTDLTRLVGVDVSTGDGGAELLIPVPTFYGSSFLVNATHVYFRDDAGQLRQFARAAGSLGVLDASVTYNGPLSLVDDALLAVRNHDSMAVRVPTDGSAPVELSHVGDAHAMSVRGRRAYYVALAQYGTVVLRFALDDANEQGLELVAGIPDDAAQHAPSEYGSVRPVEGGVFWLEQRDEGPFHYVPLAD